MIKVALALAQKFIRILRSRGMEGIFDGHVLGVACVDVCVSYSNE